MKPASVRCKCPHCQKLFVPDCRNRGRQKYCSSPACQAVRQQASQRRWLDRPENRDYFRGADNVKRVQQWRAEHPGYWKRSTRKPHRALQDACPEQVAENKKLVVKSPPQASPVALQDLCAVQTPLLVGLIAQFTDATLQEDIVVYTRSLIARGQDILDQPSGRFTKGNTVYAAKENPASGPVAAGAGAVQLA